MKIDNRLFENLRSGKTSVGCVVTMSDLIVSELAGDCGMDFCWIDAEHAPHTIQDVQRHLIALRGTGCAGLVRVRACEPMLIKPYLDLAPDGIIVPMVNTPELAETAVAACRYPTDGIRGCGVRRAVRYGAEDFFDYVKYSKEWPLVICQIEHIDAVKNLDKILKVPGVDSFCIGPCDLSGSMGILNQMDDPELNKVIDEVAAKIKKAGKWLGTAAGDFPRWKARGVDWFAGTSDWGAMAAGIRSFRADCDRTLSGSANS
jgi:2-dehydro-3-deoxyglucarate aldolase/4-hydroxy-2-oxoheptanedioate aldolase